ncbi:hypothetical protein GGTG_12702 [Gaeumannomyces tritici R3-111a-1]|uniref:Uncharacterized protein n=1 Tax=Gaeumannomyces tritici (strain R3-111a-1) TaxID=644352 RepID=J3PGS3_GAET3|nr:hypothetical protein GGTG_12702 [Gaeumannomyces tritici R3-111a-1]EJT69819.1 hypothetical protein GGTG_12702 [Gaeumannomyces tritici R3-111a-1]
MLAPVTGRASMGYASMMLAWSNRAGGSALAPALTSVSSQLRPLQFLPSTLKKKGTRHSRRRRQQLQSKPWGMEKRRTWQPHVANPGGLARRDLSRSMGQTTARRASRLPAGPRGFVEMGRSSRCWSFRPQSRRECTTDGAPMPPLPGFQKAHLDRAGYADKAVHKNEGENEGGAYTEGAASLTTSPFDGRPLLPLGAATGEDSRPPGEVFTCEGAHEPPVVGPACGG